MLGTERLVAMLTSLFGILAALLAGIGLHGLLAREVAVREREIGIRCSLGASFGSVVWTLLKRTLPWLAGGTLAGGVVVALMRVWLQPLLP
jgi:hypothetical protein